VAAYTHIAGGGARMADLPITLSAVLTAQAEGHQRGRLTGLSPPGSGAAVRRPRQRAVLLGDDLDVVGVLERLALELADTQ
jgi:hypothetical protein